MSFIRFLLRLIVPT